MSLKNRFEIEDALVESISKSLESSTSSTSLYQSKSDMTSFDVGDLIEHDVHDDRESSFKSSSSSRHSGFLNRLFNGRFKRSSKSDVSRSVERDDLLQDSSHFELDQTASLAINDEYVDDSMLDDMIESSVSSIDYLEDSTSTGIDSVDTHVSLTAADFEPTDELVALLSDAFDALEAHGDLLLVEDTSNNEPADSLIVESVSDEHADDVMVTEFMMDELTDDSVVAESALSEASNVESDSVFKRFLYFFRKKQNVNASVESAIDVTDDLLEVTDEVELDIDDNVEYTVSPVVNVEESATQQDVFGMLNDLLPEKYNRWRIVDSSNIASSEEGDFDVQTSVIEDDESDVSYSKPKWRVELQPVFSLSRLFFTSILTVASLSFYAYSIGLFSPVIATESLPIEVGSVITLPQTKTGDFFFLDDAVKRLDISEQQTLQILANREVDVTTPGALNGGTITWNDTTTSYIQANGVGIAPESGGATWFGSGLVNDNRPTHFIGHTPGDYWWVFSVSIGDVITVTDGNGQQANYRVTSITDTNDEGLDRQGQHVLPSILSISGESINVQTCYDNSWNIVVHAELMAE